ncbi:ubiquitin carboxyl-terminal hydrolase 48 [Fistulifera solaris]|uniref:ubiquitinyl hydrolase 1 n=1 Tax=Fistulifera solaris TaxID=1519565 RepID=A0A1Z5KKE4_FISSO|nr:ubiquitin carboxyl-terminal hydrolase 48 [Fistulifera solaris]|eukprot:GAX26790.1 ubiquitin carboxyl-terminal hydrolase 48 [Fistulifera solaris]
MKESTSRFFAKENKKDDEVSRSSSPVEKGETAFERASMNVFNQLPNATKQTTHEKSDDLEECLRRAQYEIEYDAYRGIKTLLLNEGNEIPPSPWQVCQFGSVSTASSNATTSMIESIYQCSCPTLQEWCDDIHKKSKRRKSSTPRKQYGCHNNPFCLLSSGGVLEDIKKDRWQAFGQTLRDTESPNQTNVYPADTQQLLNRIRTSFRVPTERIRRYYHDLVGPERVEEGLRAVRKHNDHLVFSLEDVIEEEPDDNYVDSLILSCPPGMENLGATCYLNTQLQCLAQNLRFVEGILSYPSTGDDRMSVILRQFQNLLRDMTLGPCKEINTAEFTKSLGLDHAEQQDPNEFSRLFLDKLHTSFRQHENETDELLPFLFQGIQQYETTCRGCGSVSKRPEQFMDLNLPIIPKKTGSVLEMIADPSLQDCFAAAYTQEELLEGDNQYFCDTCQGKQNATRKVTFQKLPPILNIQLNRYVYNMQTFMKQKVEQPVLLNEDFRIKDRKYRLVAVMKHKGRSAYQGHYIAEAMDWCTGLWYEFNDTVVTWLQDGPRNASHGASSSKKLPAGSSEAYNMYYVEDEFLAQCVWEACLNRSKQQYSPLYYELQEQCDRERKLWKSIQDQKAFIRDKMNVFQKLNSSAVWVDTDTWELFVKCQPHALIYEMCLHGRGLSPRDARQGKLIPPSVFEVYCQLTNQHFDKSTLITPKCNMFCDECTADYRKSLASKVKVVETARRILHAVQGNDPEATDGDDLYTFVVSRKFITSFKGDMSKLAKAVIAANDDLSIVDVSSFFGEAVVNQCISCEHGNCEITNKRRVVQVSRSVWTDIVHLYPNSIEHKRLFRPEDDVDYTCPQCRAFSTTLDTKREYLSELLRFKLDTLRPSEIVGLDQEDYKKFSFRIIHSDDWTIWNRFLQAAKRQLDCGTISDQAKTVLKQVNRWNYEKYTSIQAVCGSTAEFLSRTVHPFVCRAHGQPLESALFLPNVNPNRLDEGKLLIMGDPMYRKLTNHWERVTREVLVDEADAEATSSMQWLHPSFRHAQSDKTGASFVISSDMISMRFILEGQVCKDPECNSNYCLWMDSCKTPGSAAHEPIAIDMDGVSLPGVTLSVFEVEPGTTTENFTADKDSTATAEDASMDQMQSLRRSTRKKKSRYPKGCILSEQLLNINMQSNLAALRLFLLERCTEGSPFEVSHTIQMLVPHEESQNQGYRVIDLPLDKSGEKLEDILAEDMKKPFADVPRSFISRIIITRQALEMVGGMPKEALLDHFMSISSDVQPVRKKRRVERGFTGTFLSSIPSNHEQEGKDDNDSMVEELESFEVPGLSFILQTGVYEEDDESVRMLPTPQRRSDVLRATSENDNGTDGDSVQVVGASSAVQTESMIQPSFPLQNKELTRSGLISVASSDDDDSILHGGPVFQTSSEAKQRSEELHHERQLRERIHDLVRLLEQNPDVENRSNMFLAAEKAIQEQPDLPMDDLLMFAYCHYSEIQSST